MPGVVINGAQVAVPGLSILNWHDNPQLRLRIGQGGAANDGRSRRTRWVRSIVLHTTMGIPGGADKRPQKILPGLGPAGVLAENVAHYWSSNERASGAHMICDFDGTWICLADLASETAFHATSINDVSIGIEICQSNDGALYDGQLDCVVTMVNFLTERFRIQRQIPNAYTGPIPRLQAGGADSVGVFGHRDQTDQRGSGDPGDTMMSKLAKAGYERFDFCKDEDLTAWRARQRSISAGLPVPLVADGIPGPQTVARLEQLGCPHGLWVKGATPGERLRGDLDELLLQYRNDLPAPDFRRVVQEWLG